MSNRDEIPEKFYTAPPTEMMFFNDDITPEKKLWLCVYILFFKDLQDTIDSINKDHRMKLRGKTSYNNGMNEKLRLTHLRFESSHPWFRKICEFADMDYGLTQETIEKIISGEKRFNPVYRRDEDEKNSN